MSTNERPLSLTQPKNVRVAMTLNLFLPGAGQFYLGQKFVGVVLAVAFLGCFVAMLSLFIAGYREYLEVAMSGDILQEGRLENLAGAFHVRLLIGLLVASVGIYITAQVGLAFARNRRS